MVASSINVQVQWVWRQSHTSIHSWELLTKITNLTQGTVLAEIFIELTGSRSISPVFKSKTATLPSEVPLNRYFSDLETLFEGVYYTKIPIKIEMDPLLSVEGPVKSEEHSPWLAHVEALNCSCLECGLIDRIKGGRYFSSRAVESHPIRRVLEICDGGEVSTEQAFHEVCPIGIQAN